LKPQDQLFKNWRRAKGSIAMPNPSGVGSTEAPIKAANASNTIRDFTHQNFIGEIDE
jgi:hypothetical protein